MKTAHKYIRILTILYFTLYSCVMFLDHFPYNSAGFKIIYTITPGAATFNVFTSSVDMSVKYKINTRF